MHRVQNAHLKVSVHDISVIISLTYFITCINSVLFSKCTIYLFCILGDFARIKSFFFYFCSISSIVTIDLNGL